ncbi:AAA family ATPase [Arthrobacter sp. M4]|uniref:AAA family ATPase n=1 Tax=Arthrobacter sp. M4 TaxID=218160 RepID=UPI001CDC9829|nr:AAA family ATPase [Arthrobacter sp. M4]MCA4132647.1 AAA family ATPase [Arthrobacter sp. M4]
MAAVGSSFQPRYSDPTSFRSLRIEAWRQFNAMELDLRAPLTIITGANGTGKTTLLTLVGVHFNWQIQLIGTPILDDEGHLTFKLGTDLQVELKSQTPVVGQLPHYGPPQFVPPPTSKIGSLQYENGVQTDLLVPEGQSPQFSVHYERQQTVEGLFLNSHRSISAYQSVNSIPARFSPAKELLDAFYNEIRSRFFGTNSPKTSMLVMKESLLAAAIYGEGNSSVVADEEAQNVWDGFQETLRLLLPEELGFRRLKASPPEILLETETGDFTVDALSGGLRAIFELAWQIFLRSHNTDSFTVCIDEPENHLHPSLQRSLMPSLMKAFPKVKFLVATHSPFVVNSSVIANVYALEYDESHRVSANLLDMSKSGLSAEDTLRDVLGLGSTLPIWAEAKFNTILAAFTTANPTPQMIGDLREELARAGLLSEMPLAVETLVSGSQDEPGQ